MSDPTEKTRKFLKGASDTRTKGIRGSIQSGTWVVSDASGLPVEVRNGADLVAAHQSGADGEVGFVDSDGNLRVLPISELANRLGDRLGELQLAQGDRAEKALDAQLFDQLGDIAESQGTLKNIGRFADAAMLFREQGIQDDALTEAGAEKMPITAAVGAGITSLGETAGLGGGLGALAKGSKLANLVAQGTTLAAESAAFEQGLAQQENRPFNPNAAALDFAVGASAGLLMKIIGKGSRRAAEFAKARKAEKTRNLELSSTMPQAKKVTMANAMKSKVTREDLGAAAEILRKHGDVEAAGLAERAMKFSDRLTKFPHYLKRAVDDISYRVEDVGGMFDEVAASWRKNIDSVDASSNLNMGQIAATYARKADALVYAVPPSQAKLAASISNDLIHAAKQYQGKGINLAELQEAFHRVSTDYFDATANTPILRNFLGELRQAKHNPDFFGTAASQRAAADAALSGWEDATKHVNNLVGSEAKLNRLLKGGDPDKIFRAARSVEDLLRYVDELHANNVPGFGKNVYTNYKYRLDGLKRALQSAQGSKEFPGILRIARDLSQIESAIGRVRVPNIAQPASSPVMDAVLGGMAGGLPGAAAGAVAGKFVKNVAFRASQEAAIYIDKGVSGVTRAMQSQVARSAAFRALGASSRVFQDAETKQKDYEQVALALEDAAGNPDYFVSEVTAAVDGLEEFEGDAAAQAANAVYYLANELPKTSSPNPTQIDNFMSQVEMVQDPYAALDHLAAGTFTTAMARTLASVYPQLYGDMIASLAMELDDKDLTFAQKLEISRFMGGVPLDPLMKPEYRRVLLNRGAQTQAQSQAISSPRQQIMSQRLSQQTQTSTDRITNK